MSKESANDNYVKLSAEELRAYAANAPELIAQERLKAKVKSLDLIQNALVEAAKAGKSEALIKASKTVFLFDKFNAVWSVEELREQLPGCVVESCYRDDDGGWLMPCDKFRFDGLIKIKWSK